MDLVNQREFDQINNMFEAGKKNLNTIPLEITSLVNNGSSCVDHMAEVLIRFVLDFQKSYGPT
jgi:hypothetical protein